MIKRWQGFKTILAAAISLLLLFAATGYGASGSNQQQGKSAPDEKKPGVSGSADNWNQIVDAAKKEAKIIVAGPPGKTMREAILAFNKSLPEIKVEVQSVSGRDFGPKVIAEQRAGQYLWDVYTGGPNTIISDMMPEKAVAEFPRDLRETKPKVNDDKWRKGFEEGMLDKDKKYVYAFTAYTQSIYVNRDVIPENQAKTVADLLKTEFKGKIVWDDPRKAGPGNSFAQFLVKEWGEDFLRKLLAQNIIPTSDFRQQMDWLVRGSYPIGIGIQNDLLNEMQRQGIGKNVKKLNDPKSTAYTQGFGTVALIKNAPHPNAAKVFINWLLSKEAQTSWSGLTGANSRRLDVPVASKDQYADPNIDYALMGKEEYEKYREIAGKIAKEVLK